MASKQWEEKTLADVCEQIFSGGTPKRKIKSYFGGTIPWVVVKDIQPIITETSEYLTESGFKSCSAKMWKKGTVILSTGATIGKVGIAGRDLCTKQGITGLVPKKEMNNEFLAYYLTTITEQLKSKSVGGTIKEIYKKELEKIPIPVPPIETQLKIINTLNAITDVQNKNNNMIQYTDNFFQSVFNDIIGDVANNSKKWDVVKLEEVIQETQYGVGSSLQLKGEVPCLRMNNITSEGSIVLDNLKYLDDDKIIKKYLLNKGDILFNRTNSRELVGKTAIFDLDGRYTFAGYLVRLVVNRKKCNPYYVATFMNHPIIKQKIRRMALGSVGQANINANKIQSLNILLPPLNIQETFVNSFKIISQLLTKLIHQKTNYENLLNSTKKNIFSRDLMN